MISDSFCRYMGTGGIKGCRRDSKFKPLAEELMKPWSIMTLFSVTESKRLSTLLALMIKSWFGGSISLDSHVVGSFASQHPDFWLRWLFDVFTDCMLLQCIQSGPPVQAAAAALKHRFKLRANTMMMDNNLRFILMVRKFAGELKNRIIIVHDTGSVNDYTTMWIIIYQSTDALFTNADSIFILESLHFSSTFVL